MAEKKFSKTIINKETGRKKTVKFGDPKGTISPGTPRGDAYCSRSAKIKGNWKSDKNSPNNLSRKKWGCVNDKSYKSKVK